jgi:hypothetical protein
VRSPLDPRFRGGEGKALGWLASFQSDTKSQNQIDLVSIDRSRSLRLMTSAGSVHRGHCQPSGAMPPCCL